MDSREKQIIDLIEKIRPYIQRDGGDVEFIALKDDYVYVQMHGACMGCGSLNDTLEFGIGEIIKEEVEGIKGIRNIG